MSAHATRLAAFAVIAALAAAPFWASQFTITLLNYIGIYALVALGVVLLTGVAGLTSFGQAAFVGIGAYATAWLTTAAGASPWFGLVVCVRSHRPDRDASRRGNASARRPLPAARHHRLGPVRSTSCSATWTRSAATTASPACRRSRIGPLSLERTQCASII